MTLVSIRSTLTLACAALLAACASSEEKAASAAALAAQAFNVGDYVTARREIGDAVRLDEDVPDYWLLLGRVELARSDYPAAYVSLQRAHELDRNNIEVLQALAQLSLLGGRTEEADRFADQVSLVSPGNEAAILVKGFVSLRQRRFPQALRAANAVLERSPGDEVATDLKARTLFAIGQHAAAIALVEQSVRERQPTAGKLRALVEFYQRTGNASALEETYRRFALLEPQNGGLQLDHARQLFANGKNGEGLAALERFFRAVPPGFASAPGVAAALSASRKGGLTEAQLRSIAEGAPADAKLAIASYAVDAEHPRLAMELAEPFAEGNISNNNAVPKAILAAAHYELGEAASARRILDEVLEFDETNARALLLRSSMALREGKLDPALRDAQRLLSEQPRLPRARTLLASIYAAREETNLAYFTLRRAYHDFPRDQDVFIAYLALTRQRSGDKAAVDVAREFVSRNRRSAEAWAALAASCRQARMSGCVSESDAMAAKLGRGRSGAA